MSPRYDLAYGENRTYLASRLGPAVCGRAGDQSAQTLVCSIWRGSGWTSSSSAPGDWGYASDRAWLVNADGTISYCRRVNYGDAALRRKPEPSVACLPAGRLPVAVAFRVQQAILFSIRD